MFRVVVEFEAASNGNRKRDTDEQNEKEIPSREDFLLNE
jgi:hypothetical protein